MRILYISFWFFDYVINLANLMSEKEETYLFLPITTPKSYIDFIDNEVNVYFFEMPKTMFSLHTVSIVNDILKRINSIKPDIIHFQTTSHILFLFLLYRKYKLMATFHDVKIHEGEKSFLFKLTAYSAAKLSKKVFVHGERLKNLIKEEYNLPENKVCIVPLGENEMIKLSLFKSYEMKNLKEDGNLILFFGRIYKYKGLECLIKAEPLITKEIPNAKIIIAGRGENFRIYEDMMVNKNNFVVYNEFISFKKGAELFQRSSIVVLPYLEASQSGVVPIAYGFKKPVIISNVGSLPEVVEDNKTGLIIPSKDHVALAEAIIKLMKTPNLRKKMGIYAYEKQKHENSCEITAKKTYNAYKEVN